MTFDLFSPSIRFFVIRIHKTGPLALRPTPRRRTCPSSGSRTAATHSGTRTTRSFERERHCPLDDATPRYPRRKISYRLLTVRERLTLLRTVKLALRTPASLFCPNKEVTRFAGTSLASVFLNSFSNEIISNYENKFIKASRT